jgi:hypothetical protein
VGKKIFLPLNFLAKKEVSYSPFHGLARWRSVALVYLISAAPYVPVASHPLEPHRMHTAATTVPVKFATRSQPVFS